MLRRALSAALIPVMVIQLSGCTKTVWIGPEEIQPTKDTIKGVKTADGDKVKFDWKPKPAVEGDTIFASVDDAPFQVALDQTESVGVKRANVAGTILLVSLMVGVVAAVAVGIAIAEGLEDFSGIPSGSVSPESSGGY